MIYALLIVSCIITASCVSAALSAHDRCPRIPHVSTILAACWEKITSIELRLRSCCTVPRMYMGRNGRVTHDEVFSQDAIDIELFCPESLKSKLDEYELTESGQFAWVFGGIRYVFDSMWFTSRTFTITLGRRRKSYKVVALTRIDRMFVRYQLERIVLARLESPCQRFVRLLCGDREREICLGEPVYRPTSVNLDSTDIQVLYHREGGEELCSFTRRGSTECHTFPVNTMRVIGRSANSKTGEINISTVMHVSKLRPRTLMHSRLEHLVNTEVTLLLTMVKHVKPIENPDFVVPIVSRVTETEGEYTNDGELDETVVLLTPDLGVSKVVRTQNKSAVMEAIQKRLDKPRKAAEERALPMEDNGDFVYKDHKFNLFTLHEEFFREFEKEVGHLVPIGGLSMVPFEEEQLKRVRPAQRRGLESSEFVADASCGECAECQHIGFLKAEVGGLDAAPRLVYTCNQTESVNQGSVWSSLAQALKKSKHYAFVDPETLTDRLRSLMGLFGVLEDDFAKYDATRLARSAALINQLLKLMFGDDCVNIAVERHGSNYHWSVKFRTKRGAASAKTGWTLATGQSQTSTTNTWLAIFYIWLRYRLSGDSPSTAYNRVFVAGGDDSVAEYVPGMDIRGVADVLGFDVKPIVRKAGEPFSFFANWYFFYGSDTYVIPDFIRKINSMLVSHVKSTSPEQVAARKGHSFLLTYGSNIPVLSALAIRYVRATRLTKNEAADRDVYTYEQMQTDNREWGRGVTSTFNQGLAGGEIWWQLLSQVLPSVKLSAWSTLVDLDDALRKGSDLSPFALCLESFTKDPTFNVGDRFVDADGVATVVIDFGPDEEKTSEPSQPPPAKRVIEVTDRDYRSDTLNRLTSDKIAEKSEREITDASKRKNKTRRGKGATERRKAGRKSSGKTFPSTPVTSSSSTNDRVSGEVSPVGHGPMSWSVSGSSEPRN